MKPACDTHAYAEQFVGNVKGRVCRNCNAIEHGPRFCDHDWRVESRRAGAAARVCQWCGKVEYA